MSRLPRKEVGGVQVCKKENKRVGESKEMGLRTLALVGFLYVGIPSCVVLGAHDYALFVTFSSCSACVSLFPLCCC